MNKRVRAQRATQDINNAILYSYSYTERQLCDPLRILVLCVWFKASPPRLLDPGSSDLAQ